MDEDGRRPSKEEDEARLRELEKFAAELQELRHQTDLRLELIEAILIRLRSRLATPKSGSEPKNADSDA